MDLSIIIVNWNSAAFLHSCLATINSTPRKLQFEVIVIDNASFDGASQFVAEKFPTVKFIQSSVNCGFSGANNLAFEHSTGRNILFLNPDTEILGTVLETMVSALDSSSDIGALGCKILNSDGSLQTSCVQAFPTVWNQFCDTEFLRSLFPNLGIWGTRALSKENVVPMTVEVISGACLLIKRTVFEQVRGFSTDYFMYAEDADLCYRVKQAGWRVGYVSNAQIVHYGGGSSKEGLSRFSAVMMKQSLCEFIWQHRGRFHAELYRISMVLAACLRLFLLGLRTAITLGLLYNESIRNSTQKWFNVLRWAVGLDEGVKHTVQHPTHSIAVR